MILRSVCLVAARSAVGCATKTTARSVRIGTRRRRTSWPDSTIGKWRAVTQPLDPQTDHSTRFKQQMWEMVAKEMGLPWRAIEGIHWDMGREEMASRANVPVFQPHAAATTTPQRRSPTGPRPAPHLAPAPTPPGDSAREHGYAPQPPRLTRARSASTGSSTNRRVRRRDTATYLTSVSEGEQPRSGSNDPISHYVSDIPHTPASSEEWNGSPATRAAIDERQRPQTPPHLRHRSSSHNSNEAPPIQPFQPLQHGPPPPPPIVPQSQATAALPTSDGT